MKNITQYFVDTVKSSETTNDNTTHEKKSNNGSKGKRNRVKIKISRTNTKERVCDIVDSSNDMIDKTPSPFTEKNTKNENLHETPKTSSSKLQTLTNLIKFETRNLDYLSLEAINANDSKCNKQNDRCNSDGLLECNKKYTKQLKNKESTKSNINLCNTVKNKDFEIINLVDDNNDEDEFNRKESNAFQILMNRKKQVQNISPTKFSQNDEASFRNSEEYRKKLNHIKEKLIVLANKKGYSERKLSEIEEGDKLERIIQNRIKVFKKDERKENHLDTTVFTQTQSCGSLLNYFSKVPVNLAHSDIANVSTIVVKADVHMTESSAQHNMCNSSSNNETQLNRQNKLDMELPQVDTISSAESENVNILCKTRKHNKCEQHKHRWSLRIKLQNCENRNLIPGDNSDEESFSLQRKIKLSMKNSKNSGVLKSVDPKNSSIKDKNLRKTQKQVNEQRKLEFIKNELSKNAEDNAKLISTHKNLDEYVNSNLENCMFINERKLKRKTTDKLAPLFTKRRKPDPEIIAARRLFLQPDVMNKSKSVHQKVNVNNILLFPVVSHITQLNNLNYTEINNFNIPKKSCIKYIPTINVNNYKYIVDFSEIKLKSSKNKKPKVQDVLSEIEKFCPDARKMWNTISIIFKGQFNKIVSPKMKTKRIKLLEKEKVQEEKGIENQLKNCIWTYKYRPKNIEEIIVNEKPVTKLKEWLIGWRTAFVKEDTSSGDEFYSSDGNSSKIRQNNQVAVLLGPHGCGKTASVYAVAEEFGYTVIEVNASSRRTGKILFKELEEATKSHRIKKNTSTLLNLISDEIAPKKILQNSLILIEDIDLVFEEDEGFISATYQLVINTKRPIVMTCKDICPHLSKIAPQQNRIYFQHAKGNRVVALLQLISLAETGYNIPTDCLMELVQGGDLRKAMLKLQYLMLSNPTQVSEQSIIIQKSFWQNMQHYLYRPAIKANKKQKAKKIANSKVTNCNKHILDDLANKLNNIVLLSCLIDLEDSVLNLSQIKVQPSLSLSENTASYSASDNICSDIAEWISEKVIYNNSHLGQYDGTLYQNAIESKKQLNKEINSALSHTTSSLLDHQVLSTDYLPSLRTICRAEESRANRNNKRRNRFFHYLHSLKVPSMSLKPNVLAAACRIMRDSLDNNTNINESNTLISE